MLQYISVEYLTGYAQLIVVRIYMAKSVRSTVDNHYRRRTCVTQIGVNSDGAVRTQKALSTKLQQQTSEDKV